MASYSVKVSSDGSVLRGDNLESEDETRRDQFDNTIIDGTVVNAPDSWQYEGEILDLDVPSGFMLEINGHRVNPHALLEYYASELVLTSASDLREYSFETTGRIIELENEANDTVTPPSNIDGSWRVQGEAGNGAEERFLVLGGFVEESLNIPSSWTVTYEGQTGRDNLPIAGQSGGTPSMQELHIQAPSGGAGGAEYRIDVGTSDIQRTDALQDNDRVEGTEVVGHLVDAGDIWRVPGTLSPSDVAVRYGPAGGTVSLGGQVIHEFGNEPPEVSIETAPSGVEVGELFTVTASEVVDPDRNFAPQLEWDFGDGSAIQFGGTAEHSYNSPGAHTITLTARDEMGAETTDSRTIEVNEQPPENEPPVARMDLTVTNTSDENETVFGDASLSTDDQGITAYEWSVGGRQYSDVTFQDTFGPGTYTAMLTVHDAGGLSDSTQQEFTIDEEETPPPPRQETNWAAIAALGLGAGYLASRNKDD